MGKSVRGGWNGFAAQPRSPLNFRPFSVKVGRKEKRRMVTSYRESPLFLHRHATVRKLPRLTLRCSPVRGAGHGGMPHRKSPEVLRVPGHGAADTTSGFVRS